MNYEWTAPPKDPAAVLDHGIDWSDWLDEGETIVGTPTVTASPTDLTISAVSEASGIARWRVSGGNPGQNYLVTCRITTSIGRVDERSLLYKVRER